ncbi:chemotaxis-specific protein-glutamate methyltransferase CheB [Candidatus Poribacteria bacterium]|nr:chemotaxis-specific protein-glutamate methyltransferase CheB [Candidatus Poribacteria bacterium]
MVRVLIIDDSAVTRHILAAEISRDPEIKVVGMAADAYEGRDKIIELSPDVVTLDIEMPGIDGMTFLRKIMQYHPMPVIIVSSLISQNQKLAEEAIKNGATAFVSKPNKEKNLKEISKELTSKIKTASRINYNDLPISKPGNFKGSHNFSNNKTSDKIIAIGASTGGTQAITSMLHQLPVNIPGILIVQHMPENFTANFAERLDSECKVKVREAKNGDLVTPGKVLIAPGNKHMIIRKNYNTNNYYAIIKDGPPIKHHRPSVDVLFKSVALTAGNNAVGILMTGMGNDGAEGLLNMKQNGAITIAQDEKSSVVFGMPKEAIKLDAVNHVMNLNKIPEFLISQFNK